MRSTVRRRSALAGTAAAVTIALGGCSGGQGYVVEACPAIGWINHVTVTVHGDPASVASLEICDGETCVSGPGDTAADLADLWYYVDRDGSTWNFDLGMSTPDPVTVRAFGADEALLVESTISPEWVRVGGSEQCGGPHEGTVDLTI